MMIYLAAFLFGLIISVPTGLYLRRQARRADLDGTAVVKKVLTGFYLRLIIDGIALYLAYLIFRETIPLLLTATGLLIGMVWAVWPLARLYKEGGTR